MKEQSGEFEVWPHGDAIDVMLAHHLVVREQLQHLRAIDFDVALRDADALEEATRLATTAIDLFGREGELHAFDEEGLLFPTMREAIGGTDSAILEALDRVDAEHDVLRPVWSRLEGYLSRLTTDEAFSVRDLHDARQELEECVLQHLRFEERIVYPEARRLLGPELLREMLMRMRAHRRSPSERAFVAVP
jgi:hemerythrin-like domain-containing protein